MQLEELYKQKKKLQNQLEEITLLIKENLQERVFFDHHCVRCGHDWKSKNAKPLRCAGCKVKYWDKPARVPVISHCGPLGRPRKLPELYDMEVNREIIIPWPGNNPYDPDFARALRSINAIISRYAAKSGKKFHRQGTLRGLLVRRIK